MWETDIHHIHLEGLDGSTTSVLQLGNLPDDSSDAKYISVRRMHTYVHTYEFHQPMTLTDVGCPLLINEPIPCGHFLMIPRVDG